MAFKLPFSKGNKTALAVGDEMPATEIDLSDDRYTPSTMPRQQSAAPLADESSLNATFIGDAIAVFRRNVHEPQIFGKLLFKLPRQGVSLVVLDYE